VEDQVNTKFRSRKTILNQDSIKVVKKFINWVSKITYHILFLRNYPLLFYQIEKNNVVNAPLWKKKRVKYEKLSW